MTTADKPVHPVRRFVASLTIGTLVGGIGTFAWGTTTLAAEARAAEETYRANVQVATDAHTREVAFWHAAEQRAAQARAEQHRAALTKAREDVVAHVESYEQLAEDTAGKVLDGDAHDALVAGIESLTAEAATAHMGELEGIRAEADELAAAVEESHAEWQAEQERIRQEERRAREEAERQAAAERARQQQSTSSSPPTPQTSQPAQQQTRPAATQSSSPSSSGKKASTASDIADRIAAQYGLSVIYTDDGRNCGQTGIVTDTLFRVGGCFQTSTPSVIYLSPSARTPRGPGDEGLIRNVARHEVAHALIYRQCGTIRVGGERYEHVTDAFTALYLGGSGAAGGYGYTDADAALARDIHAGRC